MEGNLRKMRGEVFDNPHAWGSTTIRPSTITYTHTTCQEDILAQHDATMAPPGGLTCDACVAGGVKLSVCARCKLAWYCSEACQRAAWRGPGGHKERCKAPGVFGAGDYVMVIVPGIVSAVGKVVVSGVGGVGV